MRLGKRFLPAAAAALVLCVGALAPAAPIIWGDVGQIAGTSSLDQTGTFVTALNMGGSAGALPIEGTDITFNDAAMTEVIGAGTINNATGAWWSPATDNANLDTVLDSHSYIANGNPNGRARVDLTGLTPGAPYRLQVIGVADDRGCCADRIQTLDDGAGSTSGPLQRGLANYVIGSFTADAEVQSFFVSGVNDPGLSGLQLRLVPEPASAGLLALGAAAGLLRRRRA